MIKFTSTLFLVLTLFVLNTTAQKAFMKFGKIDDADLKMTTYANDTTADAVILGDLGNTSFEYAADRGFSISFKRHKRIKILNQNGSDHANFSIQYYAPESGTDEKVVGLKGVTYTIEGGKTVKTKLSKSGIFDERVNEYWKRKKFTMPNIKPGAIIEFEYEILTDYWTYLRDWEFQSTIPVIWSEYRVLIPEFFTYKKLMQGYHPLTINEEGTEQEEFTWSRTGPSAESGGGIKRTSGSTLSISKKMRFVSKNVPAFIDEPYMAARKNFISQIKFELANVHFRGQLSKNYLSTWDAMNKTFLEHKYFGDQIVGSGFLTKIVSGLISDTTDPVEKTRIIFDHIKSRMTWNELNGKWASFSLKNSYEDKKGSAADINLLLTSALLKAGITVDPVLLSTRSNGFSQTEYPDSEQFNYVICRAIIDGKTYLLDATDPYLPMSMIPVKCLNGKGWAVSETNAGWINLKSNTKNIQKTTISVNLTDMGILEGSVSTVYDGYKARSKRKVYIGEGEANYISQRTSDLPWEVENLTVENGKNLGEVMKEKFEVEINSLSDATADIIYFNPMVDMREETNPFKNSGRKFPVDFGNSSEKTFLLSLTLPDGYSVEEAPTNAAFVLPGKVAKFQYTVSVNENKVTVLSRLYINKSIFSQVEYPDLRAFYAQVVAKHAETLVIKKI